MSKIKTYLRKASLKSRKWLILFFQPSLVQKKVGLQGVGCAFNDNKTSELHNLEILKWKKKINKPS